MEEKNEDEEVKSPEIIKLYHFNMKPAKKADPNLHIIIKYQINHQQASKKFQFSSKEENH